LTVSLKPRIRSGQRAWEEERAMMKESHWLIRELRAAADEAAKLPEWKRWGAEIETKDTTRSNEVKLAPTAKRK